MRFGRKFWREIVRFDPTAPYLNVGVNASRYFGQFSDACLV